MIPNLRKRTTAYVIFVGSENRRWWRFFCRRGWRHVSLVLPAYPAGRSLMRPPASQFIAMWTDHLRFDVLPQTPRAVCAAALDEGATCVISIDVDQKFTGRYLPRGLLTCVSLVKASIGCNAWNVWTPEQLARWMLRNGGKLMEKPENDLPLQQAESRQVCAASATEGAAATGCDPAEAGNRTGDGTRDAAPSGCGPIVGPE